MPTTLTISDNIVQGSPLAAVNDGSRIAVFCQRSEGVFRVLAEPIKGGNIQKRGTDISTITGSPIAPIAVPHGDNQSKINAYYITNDYHLTEYPDIFGRGKAKSLGVKANPVAGLAAVVYKLGEKPNHECDGDCGQVLHISLFYQDFETNKIHQLTYTGNQGWGEKKVLPMTPLVGTALAATAYDKGGKATIRLFYQDTNIGLRDEIFDGDWYSGTFQPGNTALRGPLSATVVRETDSIFVFYREVSGATYVGRESASGEGNTALTAEIQVESEYKHTAVQVKDTLRFYYQDNLGGLRYLVSNLEGEEWRKPTV